MECVNVLHLLYGIMIAVGLVVPLFSLVLGGVDMLVGDVDIDLDGDGAAPLLPFNFNCLLFSLVVIGSIGELCTHYINPWLGLAISIACGAAAYALIYKFLILPLKRNNPKAMKAEDTLFQQVQVITKIPVDGTGEVLLQDASGSKISYLAKYVYADFEQRKPIETGTMVKVVDTEGNLLIVGRIF